MSQEYREFERCSTVVANAFIGPRVQLYLTEIGERITGEGFKGTFLVVQSTGGLFELDKARSECIGILESGPASGVIGTQALCQALGMDNAIAFDMGGTTAKAGVIGLTIAAARDLSSAGIRVNTIAPGTMKTPIMESVGEEAIAKFAANVPFPKRLGTPAEYADAATFLLSNGYVNGEVMRLDGAQRFTPK